MDMILRDKYRHNDLKQKLLETENKHLEESVWWNDMFWGTQNGKGESHLGRLLMEIREDLKKE